ncbi:hypothetical protein GCM10029992_14440 [Glycomyces albus]
MNDTDWRPLAAGLAETVARKARLSPQWRAAFEEVPRHHFVSGAPLQKLYADEPIVIQRDDEHGSDRPTSWATAPSLLAYMLMLLRIEGGRTVLEIGTGSGYNTALLIHRLGSGSVATEEIDNDLLWAAQIRLGGIGFQGVSSSTETVARSSAPASPSTGSSPPSGPAASQRHGASSSTPTASS